MLFAAIVVISVASSTVANRWRIVQPQLRTSSQRNKYVQNSRQERVTTTRPFIPDQDRYGLNDINYQRTRTHVNALRKALALRMKHVITDEELASLPLTFDDILLTPKQLQHIMDRLNDHSRKKRKIDNFDNFPLQQWSFPIKYVIDPKLSNDSAVVIDAAIAEWMKQTCVVFEKRSATETISEQHLYFTNTSSGCFTSLGKVSQSESFPQTVNLEYPGCYLFWGVPLHEIGHTIGLFHEQSRPDRDDFVTVFTSNIAPSDFAQYDKEDYYHANTYNISYDHGSVMHYGPTDFAINSSSYAVLPNDPTLVNVLGQRSELSFYDHQIVNRAYCNAICPTKLPCQRGGYTNPKNCSVCRCPDGWSGTLCDQLDPGSPGCSPLSGVINVTSNFQQITSPNYLPNRGPFTPGSSCSWRLQAPPNSVINFWFDIIGLLALEETQCLHWVEVQYKTTHVTRGARFCGFKSLAYNQGNPLTSDGNEVLVLFRSPVIVFLYSGDYADSVNYQGFRMYFQYQQAGTTAAASTASTGTTQQVTTGTIAAVSTGTTQQATTGTTAAASTGTTQQATTGTTAAASTGTTQQATTGTTAAASTGTTQQATTGTIAAVSTGTTQQATTGTTAAASTGTTQQVITGRTAAASTGTTQQVTTGTTAAASTGTTQQVTTGTTAAASTGTTQQATTGTIAAASTGTTQQVITGTTAAASTGTTQQATTGTTATVSTGTTQQATTGTIAAASTGTTQQATTGTTAAVSTGTTQQVITGTTAAALSASTGTTQQVTSGTTAAASSASTGTTQQVTTGTTAAASSASRGTSQQATTGSTAAISLALSSVASTVLSTASKAVTGYSTVAPLSNTASRGITSGKPTTVVTPLTSAYSTVMTTSKLNQSSTYLLDMKVGAFQWTPELSNPLSPQAANYAQTLCQEINRIYLQDSAKQYAYDSCSVKSFRNGSVYASVLLVFAVDIQTSASAVAAAKALGNFMIDLLANTNPLLINTSTLTVNSLAFGQYCINRPCQQICIPSNGQYQCDCFQGYQLRDATTCIVSPTQGTLQQGTTQLPIVLTTVLAGSLLVAILIAYLIQRCHRSHSDTLTDATSIPEWHHWPPGADKRIPMFQSPAAFVPRYSTGGAPLPVFRRPLYYRPYYSGGWLYN